MRQAVPVRVASTPATAPQHANGTKGRPALDLTSRLTAGAPAIAVDAAAAAAAALPSSASSVSPTVAPSAAPADKQRVPRYVHALDTKAIDSVYVVPGSRAKNYPPRGRTMLLPRMCPQFYRTGRCAHGDECAMLHARGRGVRRCDAHVGPHVDPSWTPAEPLQQHHHRHAAEQCITVAFPGEPNRTERVPRAACLPTKGFEREQPAHCVHYLRKGLCLLGAECQFVHAASLSRAAVEWALSPPALNISGKQDAATGTQGGVVRDAGAGPNSRSSSQSPTTTPPLKPFAHCPYSARPVSPADVSQRRNSPSSDQQQEQRWRALPLSLPLPPSAF